MVSCGADRRLQGAERAVAPALDHLEGRRLQQEESPECMMCVAGVAPELSDCNPSNAARYLGHAECCLVWDNALDSCTDHCTASTKARKLATCDKLVIGDKDVELC